jgi:1,4-dihydroxy-2-naphthoate polyprenyltransferase
MLSMPDAEDALKPRRPPAHVASGGVAAHVRWRRIWVDLLVYPTYTLPIAVAPVLAGVGLAIHDHVFRFLPALIGFLASWLLHVGGVLVDNYELLVHHPDNREHPDLVRALYEGTLSLGALRGLIAFCFVVPVLMGPYLWHVAGSLVVLFGILGILTSWSFAGRPFPYVAAGLADPIFLAMFGVVAVVGTYYVQAAPNYAHAGGWLQILGAMPHDVYVIGLPTGALCTIMMLIDNLRDRQPDRVKGWRTGVVRLGVGWARAEIVAMTALTYLAPIWFWLGLGFTPLVLLPLLTVPRAITMTRVVCSNDRFAELFPLAPKVAMLSLYYGALAGIGFAVR